MTHTDQLKLTIDRIRARKYVEPWMLKILGGHPATPKSLRYKLQIGDIMSFDELSVVASAIEIYWEDASKSKQQVSGTIYSPPQPVQFISLNRITPQQVQNFKSAFGAAVKQHIAQAVPNSAATAALTTINGPFNTAPPFVEMYLIHNSMSIHCIPVHPACVSFGYPTLQWDGVAANGQDVTVNWDLDPNGNGQFTVADLNGAIAPRDPLCFIMLTQPSAKTTLQAPLTALPPFVNMKLTYFGRELICTTVREDITCMEWAWAFPPGGGKGTLTIYKDQIDVSLYDHGYNILANDPNFTIEY